MVPLDYWLLRTVRRWLPQSAVDFLLDRGIYLKPGKDTEAPAAVAESYAERAAARGIPISGKTICVVGYGGSYGVGLYLLEEGAGRVILQDPFAPERTARNSRVPSALREKYFRGTGAHATPDPDRIQVTRDPLETFARDNPGAADLVVSNSVLEHVRDVPSIVRRCAELTAPGGLNVHVIDLRDHYFKYPFEMLCYREATWRRWLDAQNHLNRLRAGDYERAFRAAFGEVEIEITERLPDEFARARARIREEFLTGDEHIDAAAILRVEAWRPAAG